MRPTLKSAQLVFTTLKRETNEAKQELQACFHCTEWTSADTATLFNNTTCCGNIRVSGSTVSQDLKGLLYQEGPAEKDLGVPAEEVQHASTCLSVSV